MRVYCAIKGACWLFPGDGDEGSDTFGVEVLCGVGWNAEEVIEDPIAVFGEEGCASAEGSERPRRFERYARVFEIAGFGVVGMVDEATGLELGIGESIGGLEDCPRPDTRCLEMVHHLLGRTLDGPFLNERI